MQALSPESRPRHPLQRCKRPRLAAPLSFLLSLTVIDRNRREIHPLVYVSICISRLLSRKSHQPPADHVFIAAVLRLAKYAFENVITHGLKKFRGFLETGHRARLELRKNRVLVVLAQVRKGPTEFQACLTVNCSKPLPVQRNRLRIVASKP